MRTCLPMVLGAILALLLAAGPVAADCEPAGPIEEVLPGAPVVFVGTVIGASPPMVVLEVQEVWAGDVGRSVEVHGLTSGVRFGEDDRSWELGATYLVVPIAEGGVLRETICTATTEWTDDLAALRPADATIHAQTDEVTSSSFPAALVIAVGALVLVVGISALAFRRSGDRTR